MFNVFEKYLKKHASFSPEEMAIVKSMTKSRILKKNENLFISEEAYNYYTFICKGCMCTYRTDDKKFKYVLDFTIRNQWITKGTSILSSFSSTNYMEAMEDTGIIQISSEDFRDLIKNIEGFGTMYQKMVSEEQAKDDERLFSLISRKNPTERYSEFVLRFPDLDNHLSSTLIASYLGIARETLSRIRGGSQRAS